jgi:glycosyltransferase involved in cell wall biosynthesis
MLTTYPRISVVTPSFNQGKFLETTICSILEQNYPNLEYIIMDGGSTDGSVDIIKKYEKQLKYWRSEKDNGQNAAITEGFKHATGDIFAYLNSDDIYFPWTLDTVAEILTQLPQIQWLTTRTTMVIDGDGDPINTNSAIRHTRRRFYSGCTLGDFQGDSGWIQQEGTFWTRELWEKAGARMEESLYLAGDFELWARFYQHADLVSALVPFAAYRYHGANKTQLDEYIRVSHKILKAYPQELKLKPWQFKAFNYILKRTKRGATRWGAKTYWLDYEFKDEKWILYEEPVI